jgi:hypothetical protein
MPQLRAKLPAQMGLLVATALAFVGGCTSKGDDGGPSGPTAAIALSLNPTSATVVQGGSSTVMGTLTRSGGFTGDVNLFLVNAPGTVTATAILQTVGATTTATITVQVGAATAAQTYDITVLAQASGLADATAHFSLTVTAAGSFALDIAPAGGVTLQQGTTNNAKSVTITRTNYTQNVTLTAENLPTGLTAAFAGNPVGGNSSVLTLTASASVTPNTYTITIRGTGPAALRAPGDTVNLDATTTLNVTITATPSGSFSLGITPAGSVTLQQGATDNSKTVTIARINYTASITLTAENLPSGLTAAFAGNPVSGNSSVLTLTANATVTPNTYSITIRGTGPAALRAPGGGASVEATTTVIVIVTAAAPAGNVTISFAGCVDSKKPTHLWAQDGTAPWFQVIGSNDVYSFNIAQTKAGVLWHLNASPSIELEFRTTAELTATNPFRFCGPPPAPRAVTVSLSGIGSADLSTWAFGGASSFAFNGFGNGVQRLVGVLPGVHDFVGYWNPDGTSGASDRVVFLRDKDPPNEGSVGSADFATGPTMVPGTITIVGGSGGEIVRGEMGYLTGASCDAAGIDWRKFFLESGGQGSGYTAYGVPAGQQRASDFHELLIYSFSRSVRESFHTMANRTMTLPPNLTTVAVTKLTGGSHARPQLVLTLPPEYQTGVTLTFAQENPFGGSTQIGVMGASFAYLGASGSQTLAFPSMTGVAGWDDAFMSNAGSQWSLTVSNVSNGGNHCVEGARTIIARKSGNY